MLPLTVANEAVTDRRDSRCPRIRSSCSVPASLAPLGSPLGRDFVDLSTVLSGGPSKLARGSAPSRARSRPGC